MVDDTDPSMDADRTVTFTLGTAEYEIDLHEDNARQLETELGYWIQYARKRGKGPRVLTRTQAQAAAPDPADMWWRTPDDADFTTQGQFKELRQRVRDWGKRHGWDIGDRGVLPFSLYAEYAKAHKITGVPGLDSRHRALEPDDDEPEQGELEMDDTPEPAPVKRSHKRKAAAS